MQAKNLDTISKAYIFDLAHPFIIELSVRESPNVDFFLSLKK